MDAIFNHFLLLSIVQSARSVTIKIQGRETRFMDDSGVGKEPNDHRDPCRIKLPTGSSSVIIHVTVCGANEWEDCLNAE
ncbi:MAG: hypothetical protein P8L78_18495 [Mariniblastus sp.]|nr:hypothetical protein [Mariniblastus sp.]